MHTCSTVYVHMYMYMNQPRLLVPPHSWSNLVNCLYSWFSSHVRDVQHTPQEYTESCILNRAHRQELIELDCSILINVHLSDHVPDLVARYTLPQRLQDIANLCHRDVTIAIGIKLKGSRREKERERERTSMSESVNVLLLLIYIIKTGCMHNGCGMPKILRRKLLKNHEIHEDFSPSKVSYGMCVTMYTCTCM